jgi:hypothetical protein
LKPYAARRSFGSLACSSVDSRLIGVTLAAGCSALLSLRRLKKYIKTR